MPAVPVRRFVTRMSGGGRLRFGNTQKCTSFAGAETYKVI